MKSNLLRKTLAIVLLALLLSAVITGTAFLFIGRQVFAEQKAEDLYRSAQYISMLTATYQQGLISARQYERMISENKDLWDAGLYIYDADTSLLVTPLQPDTLTNQANAVLRRYLAGVLEGEPVTAAASDVNVGMIIGMPVWDLSSNVTGAVFLTKPLREINAAMNSLVTALVVSMAGAMLLMAFPAYWASRSIAKPLNQMSAAALSMAQGDFSVRAEEKGTGEVAQLGHSLNTLSVALADNIGALRLERDRMRSVLDGMGEGILAMDADGDITHTNPAALRLLGGVQGQSVTELADYPAVAETMSRALASGQPQTLEWKRDDDVIAVAATPFSSAPEGAAGVVALLQDVTESVKLERTRRDYVANVSHELRTPIASIRSMAEALNDGMIKKPEDQFRYYGYILRESMRLSRLINDLLELSRLQSGAVALEKQRVDMSALMEETVLRFREIAEESGLTLEYCPPAEPVDNAWTNEDRMEQVLVALLDNAIKYTPDNSAVRAGLLREADHLVAWVENPGQLTREQLEHVFDRFYKADSSHSGEGTGLGLSIAKELITLLGQRIWAENRDGMVRFSFTVGLK